MISRNHSYISKIQLSRYFLLGLLALTSTFILSREKNLIVELHNKIGEIPFIVISLITAVAFSLWIIPYSTDLMTNSAAGLAEKAFGPTQRTLVINSTTNLPELFLMLISLGFGRLGGVATPLGSNFANIYLMFIIAPIIVIIKWLLIGKVSKITKLFQLIKQERKLFIWHLLVSLTMLIFSSVACWSMTGMLPFIILPKNSYIKTNSFLLIGGFVCLIGVLLYFFFEKDLKQKRPELFDYEEDEFFESSWSKFLLGTGGVILSCYILNLFFIAWTQLYEPTLKSFFGAAIFAYLHYFVGSLISSLPETAVAIKNYERLNSSNLNTALASASVSNMSNLAIAFIGSILASQLILFGSISKL